MDWDQIKGNWKYFKGEARARWGQLTDDEVEEVAGNREKLEGLLQQKYGKSKDEARREVDAFLADQN